jgi:predicted ATP-dependent endonuclease of OLD family
MQLKAVFVRFYKSFNYDYLRKFHPNSKHMPWEELDGMWYPYVQVPIDPKVTTVVGANESGKSHLLTAIEKGVSGKDIRREDFCRYSQFFTVEVGKRKLPDFGFEWTNLSPEEEERVRKACKIEEGREVKEFHLFRNESNRLTIYLPTGTTFEKHPLNATESREFEKHLPRTFRIDAEVALPDSVSIKFLSKSKTEDKGQSSLTKLSRAERLDRLSAVDFIFRNSGWFQNQQTVTQFAQNIVQGASEVVRPSVNDDGKSAEIKQKEGELARDLICKIAAVDPEALDDLYRAVRDGKEGHANGLVQSINNRLAASLNFPKWWVQDRSFQLMLSLREHELVFTIRDRTKTEYSFAERSSGLKYFLSYYVQYLAHEPEGREPELLLMDEPDAFLSSQAQQDLLKIFDAFAEPKDGRKPLQVIYVTHSPFLIDKNHAERIRVLEKGVSDEGTRVVKDAGKNHYEPLRSAFGAFVGETTFIGSVNLMVEGQADQILLAGASTHLLKKGVSPLTALDLNRITIVPSGSSSHIPYLVYLARGRDVEKPPVIVLLDSDASGDAAKKRLAKGGAYNKQLLSEAYVIQIEDLRKESGLVLNNNCLTETEDLIPLDLCVKAARRYVEQIYELPAEESARVTKQAIADEIATAQTTFKAVEACLNKIFGDVHIEKTGFSRNVIDLLPELSTVEDGELKIALQQFEDNVSILFKKLNKMQRAAERESLNERVSDKVERLKKAFINDNPNSATREQAHILFDDIEASLENDNESDAIKISLAQIRRDFDIDDDTTKPISNYADFKLKLESIQYAGRLSTQVES